MAKSHISTMLDEHVGKVLAKVDTKVPSLELQRFVPLGNGSYSLAFAYDGRPLDEATVEAAVSKFSKGHLKAVAETAERIDTQFSELFKVIATINTPSKPYSEEEVKGMKVLASNVFADNEDTIWKVVGEGEQRRLVQTVNEDMSAILAARKSRQPAVANYTLDSVFNTGDYVRYWAPDTREVRAGFGLTLAGDKLAVLDRVSDKVVTVAGAQVIDVVELDEPGVDPDAAEVANLSGEMAQRHIAYMRKLYGKTPYFTHLEQLIRERRQKGDAGGLTLTMQDKTT